MTVAAQPAPVKVYTVNGAASGSSSSLPDWLTRKRAAKAKGKRAIREYVEGTIELIQDFEFPEASNRIKTTRDGHHVIATGTYKPQMRVYDLDELTLKFERHSDAENVDFIILSDDWTKTVHLQNDRSIELHTQGGFHYRTRIPKFGRSIAYHYPSCDVLVAASGPEIYRLNLSQGRFLSPLVLEDPGRDITGVNCIDINPAHQLFGFGVDGNSTAEFWDPRSRTRAGVLHLPKRQLVVGGPTFSQGNSTPAVSVSAIASRSDGLTYAIGTSSGHTLLYDIRSSKHFALKDLGYGLPVKCVSWIEGGSRMAGDGMILSADKKVIKLWDRNDPTSNFASITPAHEINDVHHLPGSGLIMLANEAIKMTTYYIPQLGPAPRWCSFLEGLTEEMEDQTVRNAYEDYKFVEKNELSKLGLDHLVGTPALKPYMHGYFMTLKLYDTARVIANPFAYAEHREKKIQERVDKLTESRIRARKDANGPRVNKALAERITKHEDRERKREERKKTVKDTRLKVTTERVVDGEQAESVEEADYQPPTLLNDPRFKALFENPEYEVDEESREFHMLNPSVANKHQAKAKTAVDDDEAESDRLSSDGSESDTESDAGDVASDDSSVAGDLNQYDARSRPPIPSTRRKKELKMVTMLPHATGRRLPTKDATFGQRRKSKLTMNPDNRRSSGDSTYNRAVKFASMPHNQASSSRGTASEPFPSDTLIEQGGGKKEIRQKGIESFGAGLEKGYREEPMNVGENERKGRTQRRSVVRSGSKNVFRRMET